MIYAEGGREEEVRICQNKVARQVEVRITGVFQGLMVVSTPVKKIELEVWLAGYGWVRLGMAGYGWLLDLDLIAGPASQPAL